MGGVEVTGRKAFHELPLVGFTTLATAGAGVGSAHLLFALFDGISLAAPQASTGLAAALLLAGMLLSGGHLGKPLRAPMALRRAGRSPLSNEVLVVGGTCAAAALCASLPPGSIIQPWVALAFGLGGVLTLLSLGWVYRLKGQLAWGGSAPLHPLVLGTAVGSLLYSLTGGASQTGPLEAVLVPLLLMDLLLAWASVRRRSRAVDRGNPVHPDLWTRRRWLVAARIVAAFPFTIIALLMDRPAAALLSLSLALVLDRVAFYGLAVRWTTISQLARVEELVRKGAPSS